MSMVPSKWSMRGVAATIVASIAVVRSFIMVKVWVVGRGGGGSGESGESGGGDEERIRGGTTDFAAPLAGRRRVRGACCVYERVAWHVGTAAS